MKKKRLIIAIIISIIFLIILLFISSLVVHKQTGLIYPTEETRILQRAIEEAPKIKEKEMKKPNEININDYLNYFYGMEDKIILISRPTCEYCKIAEPIIFNIAYENKLEINYLNTEELSADDQNRLLKSSEELSKIYNTPLLLIISNSSIKDSVNDLTDQNHYIDFFKKNKFIK